MNENNFTLNGVIYVSAPPRVLGSCLGCEFHNKRIGGHCELRDLQFKHLVPFCTFKRKDKTEIIFIKKIVKS